MKRKWTKEQKAMEAILGCICTLAGQANNYSSELIEQIAVAAEAIQACAAARKHKRRE